MDHDFLNSRHLIAIEALSPGRNVCTRREINEKDDERSILLEIALNSGFAVFYSRRPNRRSLADSFFLSNKNFVIYLKAAWSSGLTLLQRSLLNSTNNSLTYSRMSSLEVKFGREVPSVEISQFLAKIFFGIFVIHFDAFIPLYLHGPSALQYPRARDCWARHSTQPFEPT